MRLVVALRLAVVLLVLLAVLCLVVFAVRVVVLLRLAVLAVCVALLRVVVLLRLAVLAVCVALLLLSSFFIVKMFLSPSNFSILWSTCVLRFLALPLLPNVVLF